MAQDKMKLDFHNPQVRSCFRLNQLARGLMAAIRDDIYPEHVSDAPRDVSLALSKLDEAIKELDETTEKYLGKV